MNQRNPIERDVLSAIFRLAQPTRRTITNYLNVSHVTVGKALQAVDAAAEISATQSVLASGSGRPSDVFSICPDAFFGIGLYVQPDRAVAVLVDATKHTVGHWSRRLEDRPREKDEVEALLQDVARWARDQTRAHISTDQISAAGLSIPGFVDTEQRQWTAGLQFGVFSDMDVPCVLADVLPCQVHLEDTSRSLTHLELMRPSASLPTDDMVVVNMWVGMGAGVVVDGETDCPDGVFVASREHTGNVMVTQSRHWVHTSGLAAINKIVPEHAQRRRAGTLQSEPLTTNLWGANSQKAGRSNSRAEIGTEAEDHPKCVGALEVSKFCTDSPRFAARRSDRRPRGLISLSCRCQSRSGDVSDVFGRQARINLVRLRRGCCTALAARGVELSYHERSA